VSPPSHSPTPVPKRLDTKEIKELVRANVT
jgi:hypothetical protein